MDDLNLVLIAPNHLVEQVIAGWQRILPEDDVIAHTTIVKESWKGDTLAAFHSDLPEYIEGLIDVIEEEIPDTVSCLVTSF